MRFLFTSLRLPFFLTLGLGMAMGFAVAAAPRVLPEDSLPNDIRLQPLKDLDGYFPFAPPATKEEWERRAAIVRRQILVSQGLWPMPGKTPLNAVIHGRIEKPDYTVEKAYFESAPGFFVTGNLYRPKGRTGPLPVVLVAHGHWRDARFFEEADDKFREELATGAERFEGSGRNRFQSMGVQLARMGCVVWQWDTLGNSDAQQLSFELVHRFATQRREMSGPDTWGFFSPPAEAHLQSVMGLQTLNAIRSLDFVLSLPGIDPKRVAITGASGGGTQTMLLSAIDSRITHSFPAVMVSTAMQGGCTCENASLLRVGTGNVEFAALFAPKPLGMTTANDWTREMATKGFPELQKFYAFRGAPDNVMLHRGEHFPHNYNAVSRSAFYTWLNRHFALGELSPVVERDYERIGRADLTVWDATHPAPKAAGDIFERGLAKWWHDDAQRQLETSAGSLEAFRQLAGGGIEAIIGRTLADGGRGQWVPIGEKESGDHREVRGLLRHPSSGEEVPVIYLQPRRASGRAVVWLDRGGKASLYQADGTLRPEVGRLVAAGVMVVSADLFLQGEFLAAGKSAGPARTVANPREFAGYTLGYNHSLFAQRVHDVLGLVRMIRGDAEGGFPRSTAVDVAGFDEAGPIVAAARAVAGSAIDRIAVDTGGFRFARLTDYRDPNFLPGGAKYGDLPGLLALGAPGKAWLSGESDLILPKRVYAMAQATSALTLAPNGDRAAAAAWLLAP